MATEKDKAMDLAVEAVKSGAPSYAGTYDQQMADTYGKITNRDKFKYNVNEDALYQNYKDKYVQGGKMAMRDTMGKAASLTGGYGSSYGQAVGQQAYDAYLQQLNDVVPELYGMAYDQYQDEGDRLQQQYAMLGERAADEYGKYRDQMSDYQYDQAFQAQQEQTAYAKQKDAYSKLYNLIGSTGYQPSAAELTAAGMSSAAAKALRTEYLRQTGQLPAAGGGGGDGGGGGGSYDPVMKAIQDGLVADGYLDKKWADGFDGKYTQAALAAQAADNNKKVGKAVGGNNNGRASYSVK